MPAPDARSNTRSSTRSRTRAPQLRVDRVACTAHGVCASLLPEQVHLDEWGYPVVVDPSVDPVHGQTAVTMCPARALWLA